MPRKLQQSGEESDSNEVKSKESVSLESQESESRKLIQVAQNRLEYQQNRPDLSTLHVIERPKEASQSNIILPERLIGPQLTYQPNFFKPNFILSSMADLSGMNDQVTLLKRINKVIDENLALKKSLEICQQLIELYQSNRTVPSNNSFQGNQAASSRY